jgi:hypothetical protein
MPSSAAPRRGADTPGLPVQSPAAKLRCTSVQFPPAILSGRRYTVTLFPALRSPFSAAGYIELEELAADEHRFSNSNPWLARVDRDPNGHRQFSRAISALRAIQKPRAQ